MMVATIAGSLATPVLLGRLTAPPLIAGALALAGAGLALVAMLNQGFTLLIAGSALVGLGAGAAGTIATDTVIGAAPIEGAGAASAVTETGSEMGGALGVALLGSLGTAVYRDGVAAALPPGMTPSAIATVIGSRGGAEGIAASLPDHVLRVADTALIDALQAVALSASALCATAAVAAALVAQRAANQADPRHLTDQ